MDYNSYCLNDKQTQDLLREYSSIYFLPPLSNKIKKNRNKRSDCLNFLRQLITNPDLHADVSPIINGGNPPNQNQVINFIDLTLDSVDIKAEFVPYFHINENNIIVIDDDDDDCDVVIIPPQPRPQRPPTEDSGISSCYAGSETLEEGFAIDKDAIYAEPVPNASPIIEDNFVEDIVWEPPEIRENETYLVQSGNKWIRAQLVEKLAENYFSLLTNRSIIEADKSSLALFQPVENFINVGSRVIARLRNFNETGEWSRGPGVFTAGVVAEAPSGYNDFRYLIIFDTDHWLYVLPKNVRPIFETSESPWKLVPKKIRKVVKHFFKEKFVLGRKISKTQMLEVHNIDGDHPGLHHCYVIAVDASLILLWYVGLQKSEWIHQGSPRLRLHD